MQARRGRTSTAAACWHCRWAAWAPVRCAGAVGQGSLAGAPHVVCQAGSPLILPCCRWAVRWLRERAASAKAKAAAPASAANGAISCSPRPVAAEVHMRQTSGGSPSSVPRWVPPLAVLEPAEANDFASAGCSAGVAVAFVAPLGGVG